MTPLRQRMLDAMQLRGFSPRACEAYVGAVAALARYWHQDPAALGTPQIDQYLLHLVRERKRSFSTVNQAASALKFLYQTVLDRPEMAARVPMARMPQRLPEVLSREELARLFAAVRQPRAAVFLKTAYASGLRLNELCHLRVADIDAAADRMCIRVVQGKGRQGPLRTAEPGAAAVAAAVVAHVAADAPAAGRRRRRGVAVRQQPR